MQLTFTEWGLPQIPIWIAHSGTSFAKLQSSTASSWVSPSRMKPGVASQGQFTVQTAIPATTTTASPAPIPRRFFLTKSDNVAASHGFALMSTSSGGAVPGSNPLYRCRLELASILPALRTARRLLDGAGIPHDHHELEAHATMSTRRLEVESVAEGLLELLESRGVRCFFGGGAGTDFPPGHRSVRQAAGPGPIRRPATHHRGPRDHRGGDGSRLRHGHRPTPGGDGAHAAGNRQRARRGDQRLARPGSDAGAGRTDRHHRAWTADLAQPGHPLGPGVVRPGRSGARVREVGTTSCAGAISSRRRSTAPSRLRAAHRPAPST